MRIYEFAKELGKDSAELIHELRSELGFEIKSHLSGISEEQMEQVRTAWNQKLLSSLTNLRDELEKQVDDSHKQDLKETFNEGFFDQTAPQVKKDEELAKKGDWDLGSGDTIPPEITLDEKALEKLKKENEKAVQNSIKSAEKATKEYAKTVKNIVENPNDWSNISKQKEPEFISYDLVKDDEESKKIEKLVKKDEESMIKTAENARKEYAKTVHNITENPDDWANPSVKTQQEVIVEKPSLWSRLFAWWHRT